MIVSDKNLNKKKFDCDDLILDVCVRCNWRSLDGSFFLSTFRKDLVGQDVLMDLLMSYMFVNKINKSRRINDIDLSSVVFFFIHIISKEYYKIIIPMHSYQYICNKNIEVHV